METISLKFKGVDFPVNRVIIAKGKIKQLVYYWFQQSGQTYASSYKAKLNTLWRGIVSSRTDGSLVRLVMPIGIGNSEEDADKQLTKFADDTMEVLPKYVPN